MIVYHGTSKENAQKICQDGFSPEFQGTNGSHFGDGVYLTTTKKRAKLYGKTVVSVEIQGGNLATLDNWYQEYQQKCESTYQAGVPEDQVNTIVGNGYKTEFLTAGYAGVVLPVLMGTGKELVIYDAGVIQSCWL